MAQRKFLPQWQAIIDAQSSSGLTVAAYCRRENISAKGFYVARSKLKRQARSFVELIAPGAAAPAGLSISIKGVELHASSGVDAKWLAVLIKELSA